MRNNIDHDPLLGPMAQMILRVPRALTRWSSWAQNRMAPFVARVLASRGRAVAA